MAAIPKVSGVCLVFLNPTSFNLSSIFCPLGKAATESGRYVYAD